MTQDQLSYADARTQLCAIADLVDGWDNLAAIAITTQALARATSIVDTATHTTSGPPHIYPTPSGGVVLEWELTSIKLSIEVRADGTTAVTWPPRSDTPA